MACPLNLKGARTQTRKAYYCRDRTCQRLLKAAISSELLTSYAAHGQLIHVSLVRPGLATAPLLPSVSNQFSGSREYHSLTSNHGQKARSRCG
jgi:hypothetical protein